MASPPEPGPNPSPSASHHSPSTAATPASATTPQSRPLGFRASQVGRSKFQRWDDTASGSSSGRPLHSYKEALLSRTGTTSPALDVKTFSAARPVFCDKEERQCRRDALAPVGKDDGWHVVKSRKRFRCAPPRRGNTVNLRGRCYNWFSPNHFVASCRCPPRCFRCLKLEHQASLCPSIQVGPQEQKIPGCLRDHLDTDRPFSRESYREGKKFVWQRLEEPRDRLSVFRRLSSQKVSSLQSGAGSVAPHQKKSVWVRISPTPQTTDPKTDQLIPMMNNLATVVDQRSLRNKRKRRRSKSKKGKGPVEDAGAGASVDSPPSSSDNTKAHYTQSRVESHNIYLPTADVSRVLTFTDEMAREEINLRKALFVTIAGTRPVVQGSEVLDEVARSFGVSIDKMSIHHSSPEDFLLFLPDEEMASKVFNDGRLFTGPRFCMLFKRWSRFLHASVSNGPLSGCADLWDP
jgi:hypothetical protein